MIWIYIAAPYRAETMSKIAHNIAFARERAERFWAAGVPAYCPHMNTAFMDGSAPDKLFLAAGLDMVSRCDGIYGCGEWGFSEGAMQEWDLAHKLGKKQFRSGEFDIAVMWALRKMEK